MDRAGRQIVEAVLQLRYALRNAGIESGCAIELADRQSGERVLSAARAGAKSFHQIKTEDLKPYASVGCSDQMEIKVAGVPVRWPR